MVVRLYRVTPKPERAKEYERHLIEKVLPVAQAAKGCKHAQVLKSLGVMREVVLISVWDSLESIKEFVGPHWNAPVLVDNEAEMLEGVPDVRHYHQLSEF